MAGGPTFADWAKLAVRELRDTPIDALTRDYGGIPVRPAYFPDDATDPGTPGAEPYTRGIRATMYANRPWTIRQYAGFSTARESNAFYRRNLAAGQKGLSVAFDLAPIAATTATIHASWAMSARPASPSTASRT